MWSEFVDILNESGNRIQFVHRASNTVFQSVFKNPKCVYQTHGKCHSKYLKLQYNDLMTNFHLKSYWRHAIAVVWRAVCSFLFDALSLFVHSIKYPSKKKCASHSFMDWNANRKKLKCWLITCLIMFHVIIFPMFVCACVCFFSKFHIIKSDKKTLFRGQSVGTENVCRIICLLVRMHYNIIIFFIFNFYLIFVFVREKKNQFCEIFIKIYFIYHFECALFTVHL